jgi:hypothetical protein
MSKKNLFSFLSVAALSLGLTLPASADLITISATNQVSGLPGSVTTTFDAPYSGWSFTGASGVVSGSVLDQYYAPGAGPNPTGDYVGPDTSMYAYVGVPGGEATYTPGTAFNEISFLWGSADTYNSLTFTGSGGSETYGQGGMVVFGLTLDDNSSNYVTFIDTTGVWTSVSFISSTAAFEIDNVSILPVPAPEPASIALLAGGLLAIGAGAIRRKK